jgi:hypothetical protein
MSSDEGGAGLADEDEDEEYLDEEYLDEEYLDEEEYLDAAARLGALRSPPAATMKFIK